MDLAETYSLDMDDVAKKLWKRQVISMESIKNLKKVKDAYWKINECSIRVSNTKETMRALLENGIEVTTDLLQQETQTNDLDDFFKQTQLLSDIVLDLCKKRALFLKYLDMLDLYLHLTLNGK